ncbi:MAG: LPS export ABC transporter periplasmic protein LptC [Candidatus Tectomicrobia bacterium]|uniref:LPS export ABC transporter periplasmic protein LptC n=1 Tax=Tectimicrobiota bacterium TaxID=2528274 RepID=A0A932CP80_UNCTE|nr:LPS export ABC transporter periplasmic protein LptC [Candidatus Tectomicrobia bacterium]
MMKAILIGVVALWVGGGWWLPRGVLSREGAATPAAGMLRIHGTSSPASSAPRSDLSPKAQRGSGPAVRVRIEGISLLEKVGNRKDLELQADSAVIYQGEDRIYLQNLQAAFYPDNGQVIRLMARSGKVDNVTKNMEMGGQVRVRREDGISLVTETLHWDNARREIWTQDPVRVRGNSLEVLGKGLISKIDADPLVLKGPVKALIWQNRS